MRGILEHEYGVPNKSVEWFTELDEDIEFTPPSNLKITRLPHDKSVETMLAEGELDGLIHSDIIDPILNNDPRVARLWPDFKAEEIAFYKKTSIFPIMHVLGFKQEIVDRHPWVPINMFQAFQKAKAIGMKRMENPRVVPLAWYREAWDEQQAILGPDPWEYGLTEKNRHTLATLAGYSHEQGLTRRLWTPDELFVSVFQGRKRGDEFRI
jgi:4,5-dihydroxyphthalate decarboxylase